MASSTADIVAMLRCLCKIFAIRLTLRDLRRILSKIERSDGIFIKGFCVDLSSLHEIVKRFSYQPKLTVAYSFDPVKIETDHTENILLEHYHRNKQDYIACYRTLLEGFEKRDISKICLTSTESTLMSQSIFPKRGFHDLYRAMKEFSTVMGIFVAHTRSLVGYLIKKGETHEHKSLSHLFEKHGYKMHIDEVV